MSYSKNIFFPNNNSRPIAYSIREMRNNFYNCFVRKCIPKTLVKWFNVMMSFDTVLNIVDDFFMIIRQRQK